MSFKEDAAKNHIAGYNCSQSVFAAFSEYLGLDKNTALKISSGFGGGICKGEFCGAVTGAIMAIGLKKGFYVEGDMDAKYATTDLMREFIEEFEAQNGSFICKELLGCNISEGDNYEKCKETGILVTKCRSLIENAAEMAEKYINK